MAVFTPAEAEARLCPQMLAYIGSGTPAREVFCRGPRCMAWRWLDEADRPELLRRGFCGLAGEVSR